MTDICFKHHSKCFNEDDLSIGSPDYSLDLAMSLKLSTISQINK